MTKMAIRIENPTRDLDSESRGWPLPGGAIRHHLRHPGSKRRRQDHHHAPSAGHDGPPSGRAEAVTGEMENQRGKASVEEVFLSLMEGEA